jgi:hypothetical protein
MLPAVLRRSSDSIAPRKKVKEAEHRSKHFP